MSRGAPRLPRIVVVLVAASGALAACGNKVPPIGAAPAEKAPEPTVSAVAGPPSFVGRWAAGKAACGRKAWVFQSGGLQSPGALSCQFAHVEPTDAGYTVSCLCNVGKAQEPTRLVITLTGKGNARSLTLSSGPFSEPVPLDWCGGGDIAQSVPASSGQG